MSRPTSLANLLQTETFDGLLSFNQRNAEYFVRANADNLALVTPSNYSICCTELSVSLLLPAPLAHLHEEDNVLLYIFCIPLEEHHITLET